MADTTNTPQNAGIDFDDVRQVKLVEIADNGIHYAVIYYSVRDGEYGRYVRMLLADEDDTVYGISIGSTVIVDAVDKLNARGKNLVGMHVWFEKRESKNGRTYFSIKYGKE